MLAFALGLFAQACAQPAAADQVVLVPRLPHISPDYAGLVIPPNIAPLNFAVKETGTEFYVRLQGRTGTAVTVSSRGPEIRFPLKPWKELVSASRNAEIHIEVLAGTNGRSWRRFLTITNRVAAEPIDPVLIYRKIHPAHNSWSEMGLYQRDLGTFQETAILENRRFDNDCCHCHSLRNNNPQAMLVLIRSTSYKNSLLVISNGLAEAIQGPGSFPVWHPVGDVIAAAFGKPRLLLHAALRNDMRDIAELESWIGCFRLGEGRVTRVPAGDSGRLVGFPTWSPDGGYLYYCSAPNPLTNSTISIYDCYSTVRYDLMRIPYDLARNEWGKPEMVLSAAEIGGSVAQPRISPDGHWLFFCRTAYGCWPTYDPGSDLYGIDLSALTGGHQLISRKLELNSGQCESWLSWSSNSRWVVFSSKREAPLLNRPHLAYVSASGHCSKPFILPQEDPGYYDSLLKTYTIPTLATGPVRVSQLSLLRALKSSHKRKLALPQSSDLKGADDTAHP